MFLYATLFIGVFLCFSECNDVMNGTTLSEPIHENVVILPPNNNSKSVGVISESSFGLGPSQPSNENLVLAIYNTREKQPGPCKYVPGTRRQNHQCRRDVGLPDALKEARRLAVHHCEEQFRYDRWNCSIDTKGKRNLFKKVYRETAFVHALTAAALTHSVARACAEGRMTKCQCASERRPETARQTWRWGGCSDNVKHGKRVARNFLDLNPLDDEDYDEQRDILRHDSEVGISTVQTTLDDKCKCHGVSGSCSMKTCWRRLHDFNMTASLLRQKYHEAKRKTYSKTSKRNTFMSYSPPQPRKFSRTSRGGRPDIFYVPPHSSYQQMSFAPQPTQLLYLEQSPTFCQYTRGRQCEHPDNCNTLCCARGYTKREVKTVEKCRCRFKSNRCCDLVCEYCDKYEDRYYCK